MSNIVRITRRFAESAEHVFDAWLDPERASKFLFATPGGKMIEVAIDARVGGMFRIVERREGQDFAHVGRYLELVKPRSIAFSFAAGLSGQPLSAETTVRVGITPQDEGCELALSHEGVPADFAERAAQSWTKIVSAIT